MLGEAHGIARTSDLDDEIESIAIDLARVALERGDSGAARDGLTGMLDKATGATAAEMSIILAQAHVRLGDLTSPATLLSAAEQTIRSTGETRLMAALDLAAGELAYAQGDLAGARRHFVRSAGRASGALRDPASVKASGYLQALGRGELTIQ